MYSNVQNSLEKTIQELEVCPYITVTKSKIGAPIDHVILNLLIENYKVKLSQSLTGLYQLFNGCNIEWECDLNSTKINKYYENDDIIKGRIRIYPLETMMGREMDLSEIINPDDFDQQELADIKNFKDFDYNDDTIKVGFLIEQGTMKEQLYFLKRGADGFSAYPGSLADYLKNIIAYKGFQGWAYNHLFKPGELSQRMAHYLEQIFNK